MFNLSLNVHKNSSFSQQLVWKTGEPALPVNLTGCTAVMEIRDIEGVLVMSLTTSNARLVLGTIDGKIEIKMSKADTLTIPSGNYTYDLMIDFADGFRKKLIEGVVDVQPSVTEA